MKKNRMMRLASGLLVLTLLTTSVVSGTFAKYVTTAKGSDTARVAKWGVEVTATGTTFAKEYDTDDTTVTTIAKSVVSSGDDKVVAPGTSGDMTAMTLSGTPEVAVRVSYEATKFELGDKWVDEESNYYCPLVITVNETAFKGTDYDSADAFETAVKDAIKAYSKDYAANTDLSGVGTDSLKVSWSWPFETGADDTAKAANNVKDTYLGDQAADNAAATIELEVTTTVTQID